jgi:hypothetical protein
MLRQSGIDERRRVTLARGGQQHDRIGLQAPGDEREDFGGRAVQPLRVLGQDQQRRVGGHLAQQVENGHRDPESLRCRLLAQSEGRVEHGALGGRQVRHAETQRTQELMKAGERQMSLGLHPGRADHREAALARRRGRRGQQPGLPDARLAVQHERAAAAGDPVEQRGQQLDLRIPAEQRSGITRSARHQAHPRSAPADRKTCVRNCVR